MMPTQPDRRIRIARSLGLALVAVGFIVIGLGWDGMASVACADCQLPYLLSGGAAGLGMIVVGVGLMLLAQIYSERQRLEDRIADMTAQIVRALGGHPAANGSNGSAHTGLTIVHEDEGMVVAGRSTYHDPDCRLVAGKPGLERVPLESARAAGLDACRVCLADQPVARS